MPKIFADHPWKEQGSKDKPRMQRIYHNFLPPRVAITTLRSAYALLKFLCPKFSRTTLGRNKVPTTNRECNESTIIFAPPRCEQNAAWRQCLAKSSVPKISADRPCKKKAPTTNCECNEFTIIFAPPRCDQNAAWRQCFARISASKIFADHPWNEEGSNNRPRMEPTYHNFCPPRCDQNVAGEDA